MAVSSYNSSISTDRVMPHFTQEPLSYLTLPTIKNAYKSFSIKISFRPDNPDGEAVVTYSQTYVVKNSFLCTSGFATFALKMVSLTTVILTASVMSCYVLSVVEYVLFPCFCFFAVCHVFSHDFTPLFFCPSTHSLSSHPCGVKVLSSMLVSHGA